MRHAVLALFLAVTVSYVCACQLQLPHNSIVPKCALGDAGAWANASLRNGRQLQSCSSGERRCGSGSCAGCCPSTCSSCSCNECRGCGGGGGNVDIGGNGLYIGVSVGGIVVLGICRLCCVRSRRSRSRSFVSGDNDSDDVRSSSADAVVFSANPIPRKGAPALLRELEECMEDAKHSGNLAAALSALSAFNAVTWSTSEQEALSPKYCLVALSALRLFAAMVPPHPAGIEAAARALYWLAGTSNARAALAPTDALPMLLHLLASPASTGAAVSCCDAVGRLAVNDEMELAAAKLGVHALAVRHVAMLLSAPLNPATLDAVAGWVRLLASTTYDSSCRLAAAAAGVVHTVMAALSSPLAHDPKTARHLALCVAHLAPASDAVEAELVARGALTVCTSMLGAPALVADELVAAAAFQALLACVNTPAHGAAAVNCGALAAALMRLSNPSGPGTTADVLGYACRVLGALSRSPAVLPALAANDMCAVRAVATLGRSGLGIGNASLAEAVAWAQERFREANLVVRG